MLTFSWLLLPRQLAVLSQGIAARVYMKQASSEEAKEQAKGFGPIGRMAERIAREADEDIKAISTVRAKL